MMFESFVDSDFVLEEFFLDVGFKKIFLNNFESKLIFYFS